MPRSAKSAKTTTPSKATQPNILVIWGDDIGISNLSCYSHGVMGYQTPNIDRLAKEGMMFTDSYGEQSCTAGPLVVHHRPERLPHRSFESRNSRGADRHVGEDRHDRGVAQRAGLCDGPVRQEPPRRLEPDVADQSRFRRVLRQSLSPECRGRARDGQLPEGPEVPRELRAA